MAKVTEAGIVKELSQGHTARSGLVKDFTSDLLLPKFCIAVLGLVVQLPLSSLYDEGQVKGYTRSSVGGWKRQRLLAVNLEVPLLGLGVSISGGTWTPQACRRVPMWCKYTSAIEPHLRCSRCEFKTAPCSSGCNTLGQGGAVFKNKPMPQDPLNINLWDWGLDRNIFKEKPRFFWHVDKVENHWHKGHSRFAAHGWKGCSLHKDSWLGSQWGLIFSPHTMYPNLEEWTFV